VSQSIPDLIRFFERLRTPVSDAALGRFCAQKLPNFPCCSIGKDSIGNPAVLIEVNNAIPGSESPMVLQNVALIHLVNCRVQIPNNAEELKTLSVIRCTTNDQDFHRYFLRCLAPIILALPKIPTRKHVSDAVQRLVDLFRQLTEPPRKTISGLWAELFIIAYSSDPALLISFWHTTPEERFDFAHGRSRLEVKATTGRLRMHRFSLNQIRPPAPIRSVIASILLQQTSGGTAVCELVDTIRSLVSDPELLIRLDQIVAKTIGDDWRTIQLVEYDLELAVNTLRFIDSASIPSVPAILPREISDVHFCVDLSQQPMNCSIPQADEIDLFRVSMARAMLQ
jgi:hypothetical protein